VAVAAALASGLMAVLNLVPAHTPRPRDGAHLLGWWRGRAGNATEHLALRLLSLSIAGVTADRLPEAAVQRLEAATPPLRLLGRWMRMKGAQYRGEWALAAEVAAEARAGLDAMPAPLAKLYAETRWLLGVEEACSRALATHDPAPLAALAYDGRADALAPAAWARSQAVAAALRGEHELFESLLARALVLAEDSPERAQAIGEAKTQAALRASLLPA
jgi:hypothetical protein